jgi:hypothetical protein
MKFCPICGEVVDEPDLEAVMPHGRGPPRRRPAADE